MRANHQRKWVELKTGKGIIEVEVQPGQFIFGRHSAANDLHMNADTVRKRMDKLKNIGNITIQSTNQYSIITIVNWDSYQVETKKITNESTKQVPTKYQPSTTDKNEKNEKKNIPQNSDEYHLFSKRFYEYLQREYPDKKIELKNGKVKHGAETIRKLVEIDKFNLDTEIRPALQWALQDDFWTRQINSLAELRKKRAGSENHKFYNLFQQWKKNNKSKVTDIIY